MKKLLISFLMTAILSNGFCQDFLVPERTVEQKFSRALFFAYINGVIGISAAKESGKSVKEYGEYVGDQFKLSWIKDAGFTGFVKVTLLNTESSRLTQDQPVKIVEQNENKIVFDCKPSYKELFNNGPIYGVTYEEISLWWGTTHSQIGEYLGATYQLEELKDDMMRITIVNKN